MAILLQKEMDGATINISDMAGKTVYTGAIGAGQQKVELKIGYLAAGTYIIAIGKNDSCQTQLFEVVR